MGFVVEELPSDEIWRMAEDEGFRIVATQVGPYRQEAKTLRLPIFRLTELSDPSVVESLASGGASLSEHFHDLQQRKHCRTTWFRLSVLRRSENDPATGTIDFRPFDTHLRSLDRSSKKQIFGCTFDHTPLLGGIGLSRYTRAGDNATVETVITPPGSLIIPQQPNEQTSCIVRFS